MGRHSKSALSSSGGAQSSKKKRNHDEFLEDNWDCPVCTFKNPRNLYKCKVFRSSRLRYNHYVIILNYVIILHLRFAMLLVGHRLEKVELLNK